MKRTVFISLLAAALLLPASLTSAPGTLHSTQPVLPSDIKLESFEFGVRDHTGKFTAANFVKISQTPSYGWKMVLQTTRARVKWQEVIRLPAPALQWQVGPQTKISPDQTTGTTTITQDAHGGKVVIEQFWYYAPGDPPGRYVTSVSVEGYPVKRIEFDVSL